MTPLPPVVARRLIGWVLVVACVGVGREATHHAAAGGLAEAPRPAVTTHPASQTVASGSSAVLSTVASGSGLSYQWYAGSSGVTSNPVGTNSSVYTTAALANHSAFWVRVSNADGSADSFTAYIDVSFSDTSLTAGVSVMKALHLTEARSRIAGLRARHGLPAYAFVDPVISSGATVIKAQHILDLRAALAGVYAAMALPAPTYSTDPDLAPGHLVRAVHIAEIRAFALAIECGTTPTIGDATCKCGASFEFDTGVSAADQQKVRQAIHDARAYAEVLGVPTGGAFEVVALSSQQRLVEASVELVGWSAQQAQAYWASNPCGFSGSRAGRKHILFNAACNPWSETFIREAYAHESFHLMQYRLVEPYALIDVPDNQVPRGGPRWLLEGSAVWWQLKHGDHYGFGDYETWREGWLWNVRNSSSPLQDLESWTGMSAADGGTSASYAIGFAASELLADTAGVSSFPAFWTSIGAGLTWQNAFSAAFGRTIGSFYTEFAAYRQTLAATTISGTVTHSNGSAFPGIHVYACPIPAATCGYAVTGADGSYVIAVSNGNYRVQFGTTSNGATPDGYYSVTGFTPSMSQATLITVNGTSVSGISVTLPF